MFCEPDIGPLETTDDRVYTTTVTPRTDQVAHNYTLTLTVPAGRVTSAAENKLNEKARLEVRVAPPGVTVPISAIGLSASARGGEVRLRWNRTAGERRIADHPLRVPVCGIGRGVERLGKRGSEVEWSHRGEPRERPGVRVRGAGGQRPGQGPGGDGNGPSR